MSGSKSAHRNILPEELQNHCLAQKYQYIDYDEELDAPIEPGRLCVDCLPKPVCVPVFFNQHHDPFQVMNEVTMEKGDYLLCCPAKTGQHWNWEIMTMLASGKAEYSSWDKHSSWIDIQPLSEIYSRRPDTKVVVTLRNLKDAFTSRYFHYSVCKAYTNVDWPELFKAFLYSKNNNYGSYFEQYADIWDNARHDPNVLIVFYEDLKRKPKETIEKMAQHMGVNYTPSLISDIAEAVCFSKMKPAKDAQGIHKVMSSSLYRRGEIGGWKELFTPAQNEEFDIVWNEWNKDRQIPFLYE